MAIELKKIGVSAGFGMVDLALDLQPQSVAGINLQDLLRFGSTVGGYFMTMAGMYPDIGEVLFFSSLPLTIKSAYNYLQGLMGGTAMRAPSRAVHSLTVLPPTGPIKREIEVIGLR